MLATKGRHHIYVLFAMLATHKVAGKSWGTEVPHVSLAGQISKLQRNTTGINEGAILFIKFLNHFIN